ncbi:hypothetical protein Glove_362g52 [Diversispora epigaea]|uniref:DDE-1 domain-containing protein n=1 Tax=Diversispora epigaea TaxID=1348612 RepID=A0A397H9I1_9GLOM|nr:hypothetical protein Glove_362g52 [Diversispora epigaea]
MDDWNNHVKEEYDELYNTTLHFLPPNTTTKYNLKEPEKINILQVIQVIISVWKNDISAKTIYHCFPHCGIRTQTEDDPDELLNEPDENEITKIPTDEDIIKENMRKNYEINEDDDINFFCSIIKLHNYLTHYTHTIGDQKNVTLGNMFKKNAHFCGANHVTRKNFQNDFDKRTSENNTIDKLIQNTKQNADCDYNVIEWIPYDRDIKGIAKVGFETIYKAEWIDGPIMKWILKIKDEVNGISIKAIYTNRLLNYSSLPKLKNDENFEK